MFIALLDTCVLWPSLQRDFLLSLAIEGLYRPAWSNVVLDELEYHEAKKLCDRSVPEEEAQRRAQHLLNQMREHFADALVTGWEPLEGTYGLPDPDDEHVVAAAVLVQAGVIVTDNLKHFPADRLPEDLEALSAVRFAYNTVAVDPGGAARAVVEISRRSGVHAPPLTVIEVLQRLDTTYGMQDATALLRPHLH